MANDYLQTKWRVFFQSIDVDKDGFVSMDDAEIFIGRFIQLHNLTDEKANEVRVNIRQFWSEWFDLNEGRDKITLDEYLSETTKLYNTDLPTYKERIRRCLIRITDVYDVNKDGYLSTEELIVSEKCFDLEGFDANYVLVYPQAKPGFVDMAVFRESWFEFMMNPDKEKNEIEKPCLISYDLIKNE